MKIKTILTILLTAIITLSLFQNSEPISMKFLWLDFQISKLVLIVFVFIIGLIVGLLWAVPAKKTIQVTIPTLDKEDMEDSDKNWLN